MARRGVVELGAVVMRCIFFFLRSSGRLALPMMNCGAMIGSSCWPISATTKIPTDEIETV